MSPKFIKTSVRKSENLGEKLSKKRVSLGYEIKDVERAIRIRAKHIEYIENSDWQKLPPDVYVRGFLKSYAKLLKLNPEKVVMIYLKEKGLKENVKRATTKIDSEKTKKTRPKLIITPKRITLTSIALIGLAFFVYIGWQFSNLTAPPKLEIISPEDNTRVTADKIIVEGKTDAGAKVFINNFEIPVSPEGGFKEDIILEDGLNLIRIKAVSRLERETEVTRTVVAEIAGIKETESAETDDLIITIEVGPNSTTISVLVDEQVIPTVDNEEFLAGATRTIRAKEKIEITASNGGSVRITIGGKDLGVLGKEGELTKRVFTKESA